MALKKGEVHSPFVCNVGDVMFMIRFFADHELHIFTCKDDKSLNWMQKCPFGTSPCLCSWDGKNMTYKQTCSHKPGDIGFVSK